MKDWNKLTVDKSSLGMTSSCINPLLYGFLNESFKKEFTELWIQLKSKFTRKRLIMEEEHKETEDVEMMPLDWKHSCTQDFSHCDQTICVCTSFTNLDLYLDDVIFVIFVICEAILWAQIETTTKPVRTQYLLKTSVCAAGSQHHNETNRINSFFF